MMLSTDCLEDAAELDAKEVTFAPPPPMPPEISKTVNSSPCADFALNKRYLPFDFEGYTISGALHMRSSNFALPFFTPPPTNLLFPKTNLLTFPSTFCRRSDTWEKSPRARPAGLVAMLSTLGVAGSEP
eukprot:3941693-Rhodomonas_salina.2